MVSCREAEKNRVSLLIFFHDYPINDLDTHPNLNVRVGREGGA